MEAILEDWWNLEFDLANNSDEEVLNRSKLSSEVFIQLKRHKRL